MALAGFSSTGSLDKHLLHAQPLDIANYVGLVIGEEVLA